MAQFKNLVDEMRRKRDSGEVSVDKIELELDPEVKEEVEEVEKPVDNDVVIPTPKIRKKRKGTQK